MSGFYEFQLTLLVLICIFIFVLVLEHWVSLSKIKKPLTISSLPKEHVDDSLENGRSHTRHGSNGSVSGMASARESALSALMRKYLVVYAIIMGADWLQGPYVYSLYREQCTFPECIIAILFVIGFVSAGLSASLIGVRADQYGRRRLCLFFCVTYMLTCGFLLLPFLPLLLVGRVLGGISTSISFSAFESWLVSARSSAVNRDGYNSCCLRRKIEIQVEDEIAMLKMTVNSMVDQLSAFASEVTHVTLKVGTQGILIGQATVEGVQATGRA
ncbi:hypothetical protein EW146_g1257 [Bondarzewia mesenterica]|uniref:Molybdate-anion transporter n=1 Tax=Bondarzewia mesenterica TaxID=1095465 RepID=A0A4V3XG45_9AGAM|nr:hypothetical protein EW146_g1257 [Bondarzewia mesenterica]